MERGTVIYMGNIELPDKNAAAHRVLNNAKLLRELGLRTVFLGVSRGGRYFDGTVKRDYGVGFDVYEQCYPSSARQWAAQIFDTRSLQTLVGRYPDTAAVILYNTQYATLLAVKRALAGQGICILYDCTEGNAYTEGSALKKAVKRADSRLIETCLPRRSDGLIVVSDRMRARYAKKQPLLLPPLVDTADPIWHQTPETREKFTFCYAGDPSNKDRLDLMLRAFSGLPADAAELRIIGVGREEYAAFGGADAPACENVRFLGRLSHEETVLEILSCGCFLFLREPSRRNTAGFPTKFAEALTCGVPVITTAVSDVPLYADGDCIILPDAAAESVTDAMRAVLRREAGPRCLKQTFDYRRYTAACGAWLERILCTKS